MKCVMLLNVADSDRDVLKSMDTLQAWLKTERTEIVPAILPGIGDDWEVYNFRPLGQITAGFLAISITLEVDDKHKENVYLL